MDPFPERFANGETVVLACAGEPTQYDVDLTALCEFGGPDDTALVVTTTEGATGTLETYEGCCPESLRSSLSFVDTTGRRPSAPALYQETSTVFIPDSGDLERLVIALSEVSRSRHPPGAERHLVVRSVTPIIHAAPTDRVLSVLERITGLRTEGGLAVLGIDYTAHDEETMNRIAGLAHGVLWIRESNSAELEFEYQPRNSRQRAEFTS